MNRVRERSRREAGCTRRRHPGGALSAILTGLLLALSASTLSAQVRAEYLYSLSDFGGRLPYSWVTVYVDEVRGETYVIHRNLVRIFNRSGMETFSFGEDLDLGQVVDVAVDDHGDIILLSYKDSRALVTRCDFRGVPIGPLEVTNLPATVTFAPNRMAYRNGLFYFVSTGTLSVVITDAKGAFREHLEFLPLLDVEEKQKDGATMFGFTVDREGSLFFTVPVVFKVFKFSPDRTLTSFGRPGAPPGRFGIVAGVVTDSRGHVLVADKLKCVVMVFDQEFNFLTQFGYRGPRPENLIVPDALAIDKQDRLYVTQTRKRGVSVFALAYE